ncbi:MAG: guanylate kinase [Bacteroidota bacterium]|nr:guanylate kinase [Bacteroidota bacterium]
MGRLLIFSAPSGAGKSTIVNHLLKTFNNLAFSVSATSRELRAGEKNGDHYHFLSPEVFKKKISNNEFVEWEEVYHNQFYGTLKSEIERLWEEKKIVVFDIDVIGGINLKKLYHENALSIFIQPPSLEVLQQRLKNRNTETEESYNKRIEKAEHEISFASKFDKILINDNLDTAKQEAEEIVTEFLKQ